jgi:hypothetical protein
MFWSSRTARSRQARRPPVPPSRATFALVSSTSSWTRRASEPSAAAGWAVSATAQSQHRAAARTGEKASCTPLIRSRLRNSPLSHMQNQFRIPAHYPHYSHLSLPARSFCLSGQPPCAHVRSLRSMLPISAAYVRTLRFQLRSLPPRSP